MKSGKTGKIIKISACAAAAVVVLLLVCKLIGGSTVSENNAVPGAGVTAYEESYQAYLEENGYAGTLSDQVIEIDLKKYEASAGLEAYVGEQGIVTEDNGTITWNFQVGQSGFYNLELGYLPLPGTTSDIQRKVYIDNEIPYEALSQVVINRYWADEEIRTKNHNEIRPESYEVYSQVTWFLEDYQRSSVSFFYT